MNRRANRYAAPLMELASSGVAAGWAVGMWALHLAYASIATWNWMHAEYFRGESGYAHFVVSGGPGMQPAPVPCTQHTPLFGTPAPSSVLSVRGLLISLTPLLSRYAFPSHSISPTASPRSSSGMWWGLTCVQTPTSCRRTTGC
jgi:hypothetical protein